MRDFKFRAWDKRECKMYDVAKINFEHEVIMYYGKPIGTFTNNVELMQYTGLKDKNGIEIYEGDIWKPSLLSKRLQVVKFENGMFNISDFLMNGLWEYSDKGEVIGNIYENGDLLNG